MKNLRYPKFLVIFTGPKKDAHKQYHDVNVVRTEDCVLNQFILVVKIHKVDCMAIYMNNAIFAKLNIKCDDLDDKTLKASSKEIPAFLFTKHLTSTPATFEQDCKNLFDVHHRLGHFSNKSHDSSTLMTSSRLHLKCPNQMPSVHSIQGLKVK